MKYLRVAFVFLLFSGIASGQQQNGRLALSLQRAVELAIAPEGNAQIQLSGEALKQAASLSDQARAALLPDLASSLIYRDQTVNLRANGLRFNIPIPGVEFAFPTLVGPFSVWDARIAGTQNIFDFSAIRRYQAARSGEAAAEQEYAGNEERIAARVARAYLLGIRADADLETARANLTLSEALLDQAEGLKTAGTGTGIEITRAKVQLANDRQRLLVAENARRSAYLSLLRIMDLPLDTEIELTDKLGYIPVDEVTLEEAKNQALASRPDIKAQEQREKSARLSANATKYERLPSLGFFGDYGTIGSSLGNTLPTRLYGVVLRIPIFDGGRRDARRAESASLYRAETVRTRDLKAQVELEVRLSLDALRSAQEQVQVAREGLSLSESELAQARRRYEAGVAIGLEVTDAQTRLARARENLTEALYNYNVARINLAESMGEARSKLK